MHLRQLAVVRILEQDLLTLTRYARAGGSCGSGARGALHHDRHSRFFVVLLQLLLYHGFALASGFLPYGQVMSHLAALTRGGKPTLDSRTQRFGHAQPRKAKHPSHATQQHHDGDHGRTRKAQPAQGNGPYQSAQYATGAIGQAGGVEVVKAAPFQHAASQQQQKQGDAPCCAAAPQALRPRWLGQLGRWRYVGALPGMSPAAQQPQPGQRQRQKEHPHATPQKEQADVGDQRARLPQPITGQVAAAGRAPGRVSRVVAEQGDEPYR